jgi:hypothetical protein
VVWTTERRFCFSAANSAKIVTQSHFRLILWKPDFVSGRQAINPRLVGAIRGSERRPTPDAGRGGGDKNRLLPQMSSSLLSVVS